MTTPLRLGVAGLGTVGAGVVKIVQRQAALLSARTGRSIEITAVSARNRDKDRGVRLSGYAWEDDPVALAKRDDIDVFVELIRTYQAPVIHRHPAYQVWFCSNCGSSVGNKANRRRRCAACSLPRGTR